MCAIRPWRAKLARTRTSVSGQSSTPGSLRDPAL